MTENPQPSLTGLESAIAARRSRRDYSGEAISRPALMRLLWAGGGIWHGHRLIPSAGGLHTVALRVAAARVDGLAAGVYAYDPQAQAVVPCGRGNVSGQLAAAAVGAQPWLGEAAAVLAWVADFDAVVEHYRDQPPARRGERYLWLEAGCSVENVYLQTAELGLGGVFVGAFDDERVHAIVQAASGQRVMGLFALGVPVGER